MQTIKLRGFGVHSEFDGAHVIADLGGEQQVILAAILEPAGRTYIAGFHPWGREDAWREAVIRRARALAFGSGRTTWVVFDPWRDNAEDVLL